MIIDRPRGTRDIIYPRSFLYHKVNLISHKLLDDNNYQEIIIPTYEDSRLFLNSLGDSTDIIHKEMFVFNDRKNRLLALRPEGTTCVARAVSQNKMIQGTRPLKVYYWANMFRYERPQKGRYREFWQLGVEIINSSSIVADFEVLHLSKLLLERFAINEFTFSINYLGNEKTRDNFKNLLRLSLKDELDLLCKDCKYRYYNNPLRIMDCDICSNIDKIPNYVDNLPTSDYDHLIKVADFLRSINISFSIDNKLVRGLDYYDGLVFEVKIPGQRKTILGGGRYDNLIGNFANRDVPAVGFALGVDRLIDFIYETNLDSWVKKKQKLLLISLDNESNQALFLLREKILELKGDFIVELNLENKKKNKVFELIDYYEPTLVVIAGEEEIRFGSFLLRNPFTRESRIVDNDSVINEIIKELVKGDLLYDDNK